MESEQAKLRRIEKECPATLENIKNLDKDIRTKLSGVDLMKDAMNKLATEINDKRDAIIKEKLKEKTGIEIDVEEEQKRRFKRLLFETRGNEETVYFNDGSIEGLRIVTFITEGLPLDINGRDYKIEFKYSYY